MKQKIQKLKILNAFKTFGRERPMSIHEFLGVNLLCNFRGYVICNFPLYGPMLTYRTEKKSQQKIK